MVMPRSKESHDRFWIIVDRCTRYVWAQALQKVRKIGFKEIFR
jgi:hypothetical protein